MSFRKLVVNNIISKSISQSNTSLKGCQMVLEVSPGGGGQGMAH